MAPLDSDHIIQSSTCPEDSAVLKFLDKIRGLGSLGSNQLEAAIWERRFDLIPPLSICSFGKVSNAPQEKMGEDVGSPDLFYDEHQLARDNSIPSQRELHEALIGGRIGSGHQRVAHILYPEDVVWPADQILEPVSGASLGPARIVSAPGTSQPMVIKKQSSSSSPREVAKRGDRCSIFAASPQSARQRLDEAVAELDVKRQELAKYSLSHERSSVEQGRVATSEVRICGQKVVTTLRGLVVQEPLEVAARLEDVRKQADHHNSVLETRARLERAVKLEEYREQKILGKIQALETSKSAELHQQTELQDQRAKLKSKGENLRRKLADQTIKKEDELRALGQVDPTEKDIPGEYVVTSRLDVTAGESSSSQAIAELRPGIVIQVLTIIECQKTVRGFIKEHCEDGTDLEGFVSLRDLNEGIRWVLSSAEQQLKNEKLRRRHREKQRAEIADWRANQDLDYDASQEAKKKVQEREAQQKEKSQERLKEKNLKKTVRQREIECSVTQMQTAVEERPPLPPRAHDLRAPKIDFTPRDGSASETNSVRDAQRRRPRAASWSCQAKVVSNAYGLSSSEHSEVAGKVGRNVSGAGRMSKYDM